ncbi:zinc ribbon domain-containing protein [Metallosphaera tengchongensis]|uniref:zinc ribbon domain-containing protein n=1 Tax=Metallosphaera tengchongensis TaxID=1532350 RepID=UPI001FEC534B|nr:zinc ribbon domain-containing protein [Metallosphaera tengchongensis]
MNKTFQGVNVDLQYLGQQLYQWFISKGYQAQYFPSGNQVVVQAKKTGFLRHLFAADRAFTVKITQFPGYLDVNTGMANWIKAEGAIDAVIGDLILGPVGLAIEGAESLWNLEIERDIMKEIERILSMGQYPQSNPNQYQYPQSNPNQYQYPQSNPNQYQYPQSNPNQYQYPQSNPNQYQYPQSNPNQYQYPQSNPNQYQYPQSNPNQYQYPQSNPNQQKTCNNCGYSNPSNARFCMGCGSPLN